MNTYLVKRSLAFIIFSMLSATLPLRAMAITEAVETAPNTPVKQQQIHPLAVKISKVVGHISKARHALKVDDPDKAKIELQKSQSILKDLEHEYGTGALSLWISSTHNTLNTHAEDAYYDAQMLPLQRLDMAKQDLRLGRLAAAENIIDNIDFPLAYAELNIPLQKIQAGVTHALELIDQGKPTAAVDITLVSIQLSATADANLFGGDFTT